MRFRRREDHRLTDPSPGRLIAARTMRPEGHQEGKTIMSESKHTPGPWRAESNVGRGAWIGNAFTNEWAALACGNSDERAQANADLIAAAPELLAEYKRAIGHLRSFADAAPMDATAETAAILYCADRLIAKAEGRS